ncbi:MAG: 50S ribosomal protein L9 [Spirochaetes bacterium]|nr:MAG: 50S ribosomal protein L9 [Spirochaetota bacterium]
MKVILVKDIPELGEEGDVVDVRPGYARNYLFPKGLAVENNQFNQNRIKAQRKKFELKKIKKREEAIKLAEELSNLSINITASVAKNDKLFGAIHEADIAKALSDLGYTVEKKNIMLKDPIKALGVYKVPVKIYEDIKAELKVWVVKE